MACSAGTSPEIGGRRKASHSKLHARLAADTFLIHHPPAPTCLRAWKAPGETTHARVSLQQTTRCPPSDETAITSSRKCVQMLLREMGREKGREEYAGRWRTFLVVVQHHRLSDVWQRSDHQKNPLSHLRRGTKHTSLDRITDPRAGLPRQIVTPMTWHANYSSM